MYVLYFVGGCKIKMDGSKETRKSIKGLFDTSEDAYSHIEHLVNERGYLKEELIVVEE